MNIEAYDADSLRKMVRLLDYENKILKDKLKKAGISYEEVNPFEEKIESAEEYDLDQGNRIVNPPYITEKMAIRFFSMFWGREDVYARRGKNGGAKRGDSLDRIIYMLLGPLRHRFTALERAKEQGIGHYFVPRYTRVVDTAESKDNINKAYNLISTSKVRNEMIIDDV